MTVQHEWHVWGPNGEIWIHAKDGDHACERYQARFGLPIHALDQMSVDDVRIVEEIYG